MATTKYHMSLSVRGALANWPDQMFKGLFRDDTGRELRPREAKDALMDELKQGHEVIPFAECDNFDYSGKGCQGHPQ